MAAIESAWFIGSIEIGAQSFEIDSDPASVSAGIFYLTDVDPVLSLLAQVEAAMSAAGVVEPAAVLLGSGRVRLSGKFPWSLTWGSATLLRDLLGFEFNLAASTAYVAPLKSPLWWSPRKPALFEMTPLGVRGAKRYILNQSVSAYSGRAESTSHGVREYAKFSFEKVDAERMLTVDTLGGEYGSFYDLVAVRSARFKLYHLAVEDPLSTDPFTYESVLGPYLISLGNTAEWAYNRSRGHEWTDFTCDVTINAHVCPEIT